MPDASATTSTGPVANKVVPAWSDTHSCIAWPSSTKAASLWSSAPASTPRPVEPKPQKVRISDKLPLMTSGVNALISWAKSLRKGLAETPTKSRTKGVSVSSAVLAANKMLRIFSGDKLPILIKAPSF